MAKRNESVRELVQQRVERLARISADGGRIKQTTMLSAFMAALER